MGVEYADETVRGWVDGPAEAIPKGSQSQADAWAHTGPAMSIWNSTSLAAPEAQLEKKAA